MSRFAWVTAVAIAVFASSAQADMRDCATDLTDVEDAAREASAAAEAVADAKDAVDEAGDDLKQCLQFPDIYDLLEDGCSPQKDDYESAVDDYNSAVDAYNLEMDQLSRALRGLRLSCAG